MVDKSDKTYFKNLGGVFSILGGAFLLSEHIWTWGEFTFFDFIGHEWLGLLLVLIGVGININWDKSKLSKELKKK